MKGLLSTLMMAALALGLANPASARLAAARREVTIIAPTGAAASLRALFPGFESKTGYHVKFTATSGLGSKKQVAQGDVFDVSVLQPPFPEVLASGNVVVKSQKPLASVSVGVAVRKGALRPDISTPAAVKKMLLAAKSVAYPDPAAGAAAGVSFDATLKQLGIAEQMRSKLVHAKGGAGAMDATAKGQVEIGLTFLSEMENDGIDVVGPLPSAISPPTRLVAFVGAHARHAAAARALVAYLASPAAASAYRNTGLVPHRP